MPSPFRMIGQALLYAAFAAVTVALATSPAYRHFPEDQALIKLSFSHAGDRVVPCRMRDAAELAALPAHKRRALDCPRERVPLRVELVVDGASLLAADLRPSGLAGDGPAHVYSRFPVSPGRHEIVVRMRDSRREGGFDHARSAVVELVPRQNLVVDFAPDDGGFVFR
jgi:hypothetical protein